MLMGNWTEEEALSSDKEERKRKKAGSGLLVHATMAGQSTITSSTPQEKMKNLLVKFLFSSSGRSTLMAGFFLA